MLDLLIRGANVVDGTGRERFRGDVGVSGDTIAHVGEQAGDARELVDAGGLALAPGFIDIHAHTDAWLLINPHAESKALQGVTTEVGGNCGLSPGPITEESRRDADEWLGRAGLAVDWNTLGEFFARLEQRGLGINYACHVGQGQVRGLVVGYDDRAATDAERQAMRAQVKQAMAEGAIGLSSGLVYPPGCFAGAAEIADLCRVAGARGGFYATHMRDEAAGLLESVRETIEIGRLSGAPVHIAHLKACGEANWGKVVEALALMDQARARGQDVTADQYPYLATNTSLAASVLPRRQRAGGTERLLARLRDPRERAAVAADLAASPPAYEAIVISRVYAPALCHSEPEARNPGGVGQPPPAVPAPRCLGRSLAQIAADWQVSPAEAALDLLERDAARTEVIRFAMCEEDVERVMRHPVVMIASDASALAISGPLSEGRPHPRAFGTFARVLGRYVRERNVVSLEEAVRKMTSLPARRLGLRDRGVIEPGRKADLALFDPQTVEDRATYENPIQPAAGIVGVWVNGVRTVRDGALTGALPGRVLRGGSKGGK
jgi:N-acyl-D-aspartate/D-glutamate deacylase